MSAIPRRTIRDVRVGDTLPVIEIDVTLTVLVMYAGATWDFHRYHYDAAYNAERNIKAPFLDGQMAGAYLSRQLMQWGGPDAFVRRLNYRMRNMVYQDDRIILSGEVTGIGKELGVDVALCRMNIVKPDGTIVVQDATGAVELAPV